MLIKNNKKWDVQYFVAWHPNPFQVILSLCVKEYS